MSVPAPIFEAQDLSAQKGEQWLFEHVGFELPAGAWLQVQGDNGSGKTTLLRILAGLTRLQPAKCCGTIKTSAMSHKNFTAP
jgi:ABC-type transport system involved in cytochrome c biogenesis ATPase subunit